MVKKCYKLKGDIGIKKEREYISYVARKAKFLRDKRLTKKQFAKDIVRYKKANNIC